MRIAALILNWNRAELTEHAARSVVDQVDEVVIIDNGSEPAQSDRLRRFSETTGMTFLDNGENLGYAAGNNRAIERALSSGHEAVLVMNTDATAEAGLVGHLRAVLEGDPWVGVATPTVIDMETLRVTHTV